MYQDILAINHPLNNLDAIAPSLTGATHQIIEDKSMITVNECFHDNFRVVVADTKALREEVYKIRYEVYCQELGYELEENCPNGMERDEYDARSIHCLIQHKATNIYAGCVRFVMPDPFNFSAQFPLEKVCKNPRPQRVGDCHRRQFVEVSRIAVKAKFRKFNDYKTPIVTLGLYMTLTSVTKVLGVRFIGVMEARLARHLKQCGLPSTKIGDFVEHHGKRAPYLMDSAEILLNLPAESLELFHSIHDTISQSQYICQHQQIAV